MEGGVISSVILPIALFIVMLGLGLGLTLDDFKSIKENPKSFFVGICSQLILLPVLAFFICISLNLSPKIAVGLMVLSLCPGGVTSNMFSYLAKGNVALSISLTAVISLVTPFTIPLLLEWNLQYFLDDVRKVELPVWKTMITLIVITIIPVSIGMLVHNKFHDFSQKANVLVKNISLLFLFLVIVALITKHWDHLPEFFAQAGVASFLLNFLSMTFGFLLARYFLKKMQDISSICIEVGMQNGTTALFITSTLLQDELISISPAVYSLIMFMTGGCFSLYSAKFLLKKSKPKTKSLKIKL